MPTRTPKVVQLGAPDLYELPPVLAVPSLVIPEGGWPVRVHLKLECGSELQIPLDQQCMSELIGLLRPFISPQSATVISRSYSNDFLDEVAAEIERKKRGNQGR